MPDETRQARASFDDFRMPFTGTCLHAPRNRRSHASCVKNSIYGGALVLRFSACRVTLILSHLERKMRRLAPWR